ncbi:MFS general substrate transporter [Coniophora puteana RWD-64-598 SS2]|uniref:MFS general substrate transporter n=1 Tax=Coniophora puteana (strain RWD-64-598) TaxID=741705 RepID=A0A5M3MG91_CONPW|nr:MFS general substrate transporter [Coniophora puteana RWD-64-598 SS2]EIW78183.1 MFS general substrate transporter [Coniophora puteana RWD-64-598 SS2]
MSLSAPLFDAGKAVGDAQLVASAAAAALVMPQQPRISADVADGHSSTIELQPVAPHSRNSTIAPSVGFPSSLPIDHPTKAQRVRSHVQLAALCMFVFIQGWNDASNGPLLPRIQQVYNLDYAVVSLLFVFSFIGFISGAISNVVLTEKVGFGKLVVLGSALQATGYAIEAAAPPFPVFVLGYYVAGFGMALQNAQAVSYVAKMKDKPELKMAIFMAVYGPGAVLAPLVATHFSTLPRWSFHFLTSLGLSLLNIAILSVVFRFKKQDDCLAQIGLAPASDRGTSNHSEFRQILALKEVHLLTLFVLFYNGVEVTIGGWTITYIINVRGGGSAAGYISMGFFGGMAVGRLGGHWVNKKVGERLALIVYAILAIALEFVVWFVPSLSGDAFAIAAIGLLIGPMYPIAMNHAGRVLPRWLLTGVISLCSMRVIVRSIAYNLPGSIGWIAGVGQAGSALLPFMAGAIASKAGIATLQPVLVGFMAVMAGFWLLVPASSHRHD